MNNPRLTVTLLILITLAALYTSGRMQAIWKALTGKGEKSGKLAVKK